MDEELEHLWQNLKLTEEEEEGVIVSRETLFEGSPWVPHCLLVSLLTKKNFNKEAFKGTMEKIWRSTPPKKITDVGENLFIFQFMTEEDREIIINSGPWNFDDRMVMTKPLEKEDRPGKEQLTKAQIWMQIYGLPFAAMSEKMGRVVGAKVGRVIAVKTDEEGWGIGACLAVRVEIDVKRPLMRRMKIAVGENQVLFVNLKYERLPALCYCCGIIGHNEADCGIAIKKRKEGRMDINQYGKWIRAPARQKIFKGNGGYGGTIGNFNQNKTDNTAEEQDSRGEVGGQGREEATTEEERGISVIKSPQLAVTEIPKNRSTFQKEINKGILFSKCGTGSKTLNLENTPRFGEENLSVGYANDGILLQNMEEYQMAVGIKAKEWNMGHPMFQRDPMSQTDPHQTSVDPNLVQADPNHAQVEPNHAQADPTHVLEKPSHTLLDPSHPQADLSHAQVDPSHSKADPSLGSTTVGPDSTNFLRQQLTPNLEFSPFPYTILTHNQIGMEMDISENGSKSGNKGGRGSWKRIERKEELSEENSGHLLFNKLRKRGEKEGEMGVNEIEEQGKRRKIQGQMEVNVLAVAVEQPRQIQ